MSLSQFLSILRARWKLVAAIFTLLVIGTTTVSLLLPKKYTAVAAVVVDTSKPDLVNAMLFQGANPSFMATQIDVMQSDRVAQKVVRNLRLTENPALRSQWMQATEGEGSFDAWVAKTLGSSLDVRPSRESNVITIAYKAADPRFAAGMANAFMQAYLETSLELRVDPAKQFSTFFESRAKEARAALEAAQSRVSEYQRAKGIIANDERLDVENARLNELSSQLVALQAVASDSGSRQAAATGGGADRMSEVLNSSLVASLKADQARLEARLQELTSRLGERHPQVVEARANLNELRQRIEAETRKITSGVGVTASINRQRVAELKAALDAQRSKVLQMKAVRDEGAVLLRDAENAQRAYDQVLTRLNQTSLESQATSSNISVLTQAVPPTDPTSPRVMLNILMALFAGTVLGAAAALLLEMRDPRVRSRSDLSATLGLPVLGVVPAPSAALPGKRWWQRGQLTGPSMQDRLLGHTNKGSAPRE